MLAPDVELIREMFEAFDRGDYDAATAMLHEDAEMHQAPEIPDADSYYGRDEFVRGLTRWLSGWEPGFQFAIDDAVDAGDCVLLKVVVHGRGRGSGIQLDDSFFHVWEIRDGRPFRCQAFRDEAKAREAAGLPGG